MSLRGFVPCLAVSLAWGLLAQACASAPATVPPMSTPPPSAPPSGEASASPPPVPVPSATASEAPQVAAAPPADAPDPLCIDGQLLMGACICDKGKGVDATGHCVLMPCPKSESGGTVFRDPSGQCMECRPGTKPSPDGKCLH